MLRNRQREENEAFRAFCGSLALKMEYAAPRRGNEKGGVEGYVGYVEDNFFRPTPPFPNLEALNSALERFCVESLGRLHATHRESVHSLFARERLALRQMPEELPLPCIREYVRVNKFAEVTVETSRYSVPTRYAHRHAITEICDDRVTVIVDGERVAEHRRAVGKHQHVIDPLHYVDLISRKHRSATSALAFAEGRLPHSLLVLRDQLIERDGPMATKTWTAILRLALESSLDALVRATEIALARGTLDPHAIALLLRQRSRVAPTHIALKGGTPAARAQIVDLAAYQMATLVERTS